MTERAIRTEQQALRALIDDITRGLRTCLRPDGDLLDPCSGKPSPPDHYAHLFTALALAYEHRCEGGHDHGQDHGDDDEHKHDPAITAEWQRPIVYWLELKPAQRAHAPFNRLGLRLLEAHLFAQEQPTNRRQSLQSLVHKGLSVCPTARGYPSNNWTLLATAVQLVERPDSTAALLARTRLHRQLNRWVTHAGGFIDFPRRAHPSGRGATPVAYHLKYLFCLWLALGAGEDRRLLSALTRGLDWLSLVLTDQGYCGGFGRTNHGLFGDACILTVLHGLLRHESIPDESAATLLQTCTALRQRLTRQQRQDGLLWLTPGGGCGTEAGWDHYMHLTVYNAWTAGLLSAVLGGNHLLLGQPSADWRPAWSNAKLCREDRDAGLLRYRNRDAQVDLLLSTHGQPVQGYSRKEVDLRQSALTPFHLECSGHPWLAPPLRIATNILVHNPALAGCTPLVEYNGQLYGMLTLQSIRWLETSQGLWIEGHGQPQALTRAPLSPNWGRFIEAIDWRLLGGKLGRHKALRPEKLTGHYWRLRLELDAHSRCLGFMLELNSAPSGSSARWLNPQGSALLDADGASLTPLGPAQANCNAPIPWPQKTQRWRWQIAAKT